MKREINAAHEKGEEMMKKRWMKAGVLFLVFIAALVVSSLIINRGTDDSTISLGEPTLPRVSFTVEGKVVNTLAGYVSEMDITAMRDTITPVAEDGILTMNLERNDQEIDGIRYEVYSLNGEYTYLQDAVKDISEDQVSLDLSRGIQEDIAEAVLKVILSVGDQEVYYYTRIERIEGLFVKECMDFGEDFHGKTFDSQYAEELENYLEPGEESDNTTYQTVNIHSDAVHITWGKLAPEVSTDVEWSIKESNSVYTSLLARYQVTCAGDQGEVETYNIREFFRVRCSEGEMYLLNYDRSMNQVFNGNKQVMDEDGILLGMADPDVAYEVNEKGNIIAFVQERDLWVYDQDEDTLSLVFSFANMEGQDVRNRNDEHAVRIISIDNNGSTTFAVYGYMNRGEHEGKVGVDIYYYDIEKNAVEEKAFIPSTKAFAIAEDELGKMVYYNQEQQLLHVLAGGTLYQVDLETDEQEILAENLEEGQYVVSEDGHLLAYQTDGDVNTASAVQVLDLETGESYTVNAPEGEAVRPLGFVFTDFLCGYVRAEDTGRTVAGEELLPMYKMEIRDTSNKVVKTYDQEGIYISDILIDTNLVTLNRVTKSGDIYTGTTQDYITNNEERKEQNITLETFYTDLKEKQMRFTFADGIDEVSPKILRPKQVMLDDPITISFDEEVKADKYYVYGVGKLVGIYDKAAYAIQKAEQISGVVISSEQSYIWEKGNRDLVYYTDVQPFQKAEGQSSMEACTAFMEQYGAKRIDLTGCTLSQVLYIINKGMPVIAMTDSSHAILLTGYSLENVTYIDPDSGAEATVTMEEMEAMIAGSGNTFIGYVR